MRHFHARTPQDISVHKVLRSHHNDALAAARSLTMLANTTADTGTKHLARADAGKLYKLHRERKRRAA